MASGTKRRECVNQEEERGAAARSARIVWKRWLTLAGAAIALILLVARLLSARGEDILSVILGKHAWALVGRPNQELGILQRLP